MSRRESEEERLAVTSTTLDAAWQALAGCTFFAPRSVHVALEPGTDRSGYLYAFGVVATRGDHAGWAGPTVQVYAVDLGEDEGQAVTEITLIGEHVLRQLRAAIDLAVTE